MADESMLTVLADTNSYDSFRGIWWVDSDVGYIFFHWETLSSKLVLVYKTSDGGVGWSLQDSANDPAYQAASGPSVIDPFFDRAAGLIRFAYPVTNNGLLSYFTFDYSTDEWDAASPVTIGSPSRTIDPGHTSITKAASGRLYASYCNHSSPNGSSMAAYSDNDGVSWTAITHPYPTTSNQYLKLFPLTDATDPDDILAIGYNSTGHGLTKLVYDASMDTWSTFTMLTVTDGTSSSPLHVWDAKINPVTGDLLVASMSAYDNADTRLYTWTVNKTTGSSSLKERVVTGVDDVYYPAIGVHPDTGDIYVAYAGSDDGSETLGTAVKIYYKVSTDGMETWSEQQAYSEDTADDIRGVWMGDGPGWFMPTFFNDDTNTLYTNLNNAVSFAPAPSTIEGAASVFLQALVAAASGDHQEPPSGTGASFLAALTAEGSGGQEQSGTGEVNLPAIAAALLASMVPEGVGNGSLPALTVSASGAQAQAGDAAVWLQALSASGVGEQEDPHGAIAAGLQALTTEAAAQHAQSGTGDVSLQALVADAMGIHAQSGMAEVALPALLASGAGVHGQAGAASVVLGALSTVATGAAPPTGAGAPFLQPLGVMGLGSHGQVAVVAVSLPVLGALGSGVAGATDLTGIVSLQPLATAATGSMVPEGVGSVSLAALHAGLAASHGQAGTADVWLQALSAEAAGMHGQSGTGNVLLQPLSVAGSGAQELFGSGFVWLAPLTAGAAGSLKPEGLVAVTLQPLSAGIAGFIPISGDLGALLGALELTALGRAFVRKNFRLPGGLTRVTVTNGAAVRPEPQIGGGTVISRDTIGGGYIL